jgi:hypothetical protein
MVQAIGDIDGIIGEKALARGHFDIEDNGLHSGGSHGFRIELDIAVLDAEARSEKARTSAMDVFYGRPADRSSLEAFYRHHRSLLVYRVFDAATSSASCASGA